MTQILTGRYSSTINDKRLAAFSQLRDVARMAKMVTRERGGRSTVEKLVDRIIAIENMHVKCNYCLELVDLPYVWIVDLKKNLLLSIIDSETGTEFLGWDSIVPGFGTTRMKHPHVAGQKICIGSGSTAFTGKYAAMNALMMGLNPGSEYFSGRGWLATVGHQCEKTRFCPDHGFSCAWHPREEGTFRAEAAWTCKRRYVFTGTVGCDCEGDIVIDSSQYMLNCGSGEHHYSWGIAQIVDLTDITQILIDYNLSSVGELQSLLQFASRRTGRSYPDLNSYEEIRSFINS
jgi:hypothetical protein